MGAGWQFVRGSETAPLRYDGLSNSGPIMKGLHLVLAGVLFSCLFSWPYAYYQFVRWAAMVGFAVLALQYYRQGRESIAILFFCLALLFQPFAKVALGRAGWNIVDVAVGLLLIILAFRRRTATTR